MTEQNIYNQGIKYVQTFDFKTLYTDIPHNDIKNNLTYFVNSIYKLKNKLYINICNKTETFSDKANQYGSFTENQFISQLHYLIENAYIYIDNKLLKLIIGIPTGTNCASDLANVFLHVYERKKRSKALR